MGMNRMFRKLPIFVRRLSLFVVIGIAFIVGRWSTHFPEFYLLANPFPEHADYDIRETNFLALVDSWNKFIAANDGYIAGDTYRSLLNSGYVKTFDELREAYFSPWLPPRLNPQLVKNPKWFVFSFYPTYYVSDFVWEYYADGCWLKLRSG